MCLMCERYIDLCKDEECVAAAVNDISRDWNVFTSRSGWTAVLWRGYDEPCEHIKAANPDWAKCLEDAGADERRGEA